MASASSIPVMKPSKVVRVLEFRINAAHITNADVAIVCCIDPRWWKPYEFEGNRISSVQAFLNTKGWEDSVPLTEAGGIKVLVSNDPADVACREVLFARIEQELGLHHPRVLAISVHRDCGAYGYTKAFGNDEGSESARLYADLWQAKQLLEPRFGSRAKLEFYVFDAEGVEEISF